MSDITVLITGAGTTTALSVLKGLRHQTEVGLRTVTTDMDIDSVGRYFSDAFYRVPPAGDPGFVDALLDICQYEGVELLIPIIDYEFLPLARTQEYFAAIGCRVVISNEETIRDCNEKDRTHARFAALGIPKPALYRPDDILGASPEDIPFPLMIKPRVDGRGSIDVYKLDDADDLAYLSPRVRDPLFEEYIEGNEYTIDTVSDFDGRVLAAVPRRRIAVKAGICYKGCTERNDELVHWGARVASALGIVGPSNIQCRVTGTGDIKFFEVNPRFAATLPITIAAGVNMPLLLLKLALGIPIGDLLGEFREIMMFRYWDEVFVPVQEAGDSRAPWESAEAAAAQ